jgi:hypothetical protein
MEVSSGNRVRQSTYDLQRFETLRKSVVNVLMRKGVWIPDALARTETSGVIGTSYTYVTVFAVVIS